MPLEAVRIAAVGGRERAAWAEGRIVTLPSALLDRLNWRRFIVQGSLALPADAQPADADAAAALREHAAFTDHPPASARLPVSYHHVPAWARSAIAFSLGRWNRGRSDRWARFPSWPLDLSADFVTDVSDAAAPPARARTPVVLTHDIDSPEGLARLVDDFLPLEEQAGARSTSYIVPCAWPLDHARVGETVARGHEVGVHGYDHSNRTPFASDDERRRRLDGANALVARYGIAGYRAPSLLRTRALLRDLRGRYHYDSSIPTSGGLFPVPNNGCATARPFTIEGMLELPLSMPRDGSLRFLGYSAEDIARLWIECAETVARARGVIVLLTHCERRFSGNPPMLAAYTRLLEHIGAAPARFAFATPSAVLGLPDRPRHS